MGAAWRLIGRGRLHLSLCLGNCTTDKKGVPGPGLLALSSAALTRVFTHIYLRDPNVDLDSLLEPASGELSTAATEAVKGRAEALLGKFRAFSIRTKQGAGDPTAP